MYYLPRKYVYLYICMVPLPKTHNLHENYVHLHLLLAKHSCTSFWNLYFPKLEMTHFPMLASLIISHWPTQFMFLASPIFRISRFPDLLN